MSYATAVDAAGAGLLVSTALIAYLYQALTLTFIFKKAGLKAWPAWVPIFSTWRVLQLGGQKGWWVLVGLIPIIGSIPYLVFLIIAGIKIQTAFAKPGAFYLLAILITPIWDGILAWDSSTWKPKHTSTVPPSGYESSSA